MIKTILPGRLGPGDVWEPMPWPGCSVADDPGMMESLLHTDRVSAKHSSMVKYKNPKGLLGVNSYLFSPASKLYLCGWRYPPSPSRTWSGRCRAWSRAPDPPVQGSGPWSWLDTSPAFRGSVPGPPLSDRDGLSARCCCWPWSRESPQSAHSHRRAEREKNWVV